MEPQSHVPSAYSSLAALPQQLSQHQQQEIQQQQQQHQISHHQPQQLSHQNDSVGPNSAAGIYNHSYGAHAGDGFTLFSGWQAHDPLLQSTGSPSWGLNGSVGAVSNASNAADTAAPAVSSSSSSLTAATIPTDPALSQLQEQYHSLSLPGRQPHRGTQPPSSSSSSSSSPSTALRPPTVGNNSGLLPGSPLNGAASSARPAAEPAGSSTVAKVGTEASSTASTPKSIPSLLSAQKPAPKSASSQPPATTRPASKDTPSLLVRDDIFPSPSGTVSGPFLIKDWDTLLKETNSRKFQPFLSIGNYLLDIPTTKTVVPAYHPRKSKNQLRQLGPVKDRILVKPASITKRLAASSSEQYSESESESSDYSEDSDSESEAEDIVETSPLPPVRPTEPSKAVAYDATKALWLPRNRPAGEDQIRQGLTNFWNVVRPIRDNWKEAQDKLKKAEDSSKSSLILSRPVERQRGLLEAAFQAALTHGHPDILRHLSKAKAYISIFEHLLIDRATDLDFNCRLVQSILQILSSTMDPDALKITRLPKILPRFIKRGDAQIKSLASSVYKLAAQTDSQEAKIQSGSSAPSKPGDMDSRKVVPTDKPLTAARPIVDGASTASQGAKASASTPALAQPVKSKAGQISKTSVLGAALASRSASGTVRSSTLSKPDTRSGQMPKPAVKPAFSFAETMANLMKPKDEEPKVPAKDITAPESEEERAKRLRKEARRKLRVTWASPRDLEQIRTFHRDPEEIGRNPNAHRDLDVNNEGIMFKQKKAIVVEEDDDEIDDLLKEWSLPSDVDFSCIDPQERSRNYWPFGGGLLHCESKDKEEQEQREATTLSVHYLAQADIPPTPRELPEDSFPPPVPPTEFGPPSDLTVSRLIAQGVISPPLSSAIGPNSSGLSSTAAPDFAAIMSKLNGQGAVTLAVPESVPDSTSAVGSILSKLRASGFLPADATPTPAPPTQPAASMGTAASSAPGVPPTDFSSIMALLGGQAATQAAAVAAPSVPPAPVVNDPVSVLLDQLRRAAPASTVPSTTALPSHHPSQGVPIGPHGHAHSGYDHEDHARARDRDLDRERGYDADYDFNRHGWGEARTGHHQGYHGPPRDPSSFHDGEGRKRMREMAVGEYGREVYDYDERETKRRWKTKFEEKASRITCRFWREGKCKKGESCPFRHSM